MAVVKSSTYTHRERNCSHQRQCKRPSAAEECTRALPLASAARIASACDEAHRHPHTQTQRAKSRKRIKQIQKAHRRSSTRTRTVTLERHGIVAVHTNAPFPSSGFGNLTVGNAGS